LFWPYVCQDSIHLANCALDWVGVPEFHSVATTNGRAYNSLFRGEKLEFKLIALYINWQSVRRGKGNRGFARQKKACASIVPKVKQNS